MRRISSNMSHNDLQYALRTQESKLNALNNQIGSQQKIQTLRDDPLAAGHGVRYQSYLARLERFEENAEIVDDNIRTSEGYVNQSLQLLQRLRELTVAGANGTYTPGDLKNMAIEVDELLKEMVLNANAVGPNGGRLFSGTKLNTEPFVAIKSDVPGADEPMISGVEYHGSIGVNKVEIDENAHIAVDQSGSRIFWAERQQLLSSADATGYYAPSDASIEIDGVAIPITAGDNVYAIIAKINDSGAPVRASLDPITRGLNLETTDAHQLWLEDAPGGNVLSSLGLIKEGERPPYNYANDIRVGGSSAFDVFIGIRDAMLKGDGEYLGGRGLRGADAAIDNLSARLAEMGSQTERLAATRSRLSQQIPVTTGFEARELDLDFTKAITDLKMMEYTQRATMGAMGRLYSNSLLNYLK